MSLNSRLTTLESSGLIHLAQTHPELEYLFHHALLQDVAYESLLKTDRKRLHLTVGESLEDLYPNRAEELAPLLGQHFCLGGDEARGIKYLIMAGDAAARVYANAEARQHYSSALKFMRQNSQYHPQLQEVFLKCGRGCEMTGHYDEALATYGEMESFAREIGDEKLKLAALIARATVYCAPTSKYDTAKGEILCAEARELAQRLNDRTAEAKILWNLALVNKFINRWDEVLKYGEESIAIARELNLRELLAFVLNDIYVGYMTAGRLSYAMKVLEESSALWRELNNSAMLADNLTGLATLNSMLGNVKRSLELAEEAYRLNLLMRNGWGRSYSAWVLGQNYFYMGDTANTILFLEEAIRYGEEVGFRIAPIAARGMLGTLFGRMGQLDRGLKILQEAFEYGQQSMPRWMPMIYASQAWLYVQQGDLTKSAEAIQQGDALAENPDPQSRYFLTIAKYELKSAQNDWAEILTIIEPITAMMRQAKVSRFLPNLFYCQACTYISLGRIDEGRALLIEACTLAEDTEARVALYPCLIALAKLETDQIEIRKWLTRAHETILYIADHSPADLRETFLQTADVKYILESV